MEIAATRPKLVSFRALAFSGENRAPASGAVSWSLQMTQNIEVGLAVPTAAGGANDAMARIIAQGMSVRLGKPVIVENKAGANGAIASEYVAKAASDGYTIMFGYIATHGINAAGPVRDYVASLKSAIISARG